MPKPTLSQQFVADPFGFMASHLVQVLVFEDKPGRKRVRLRRDDTKSCRTKLLQTFGKGKVPVCILEACNDQNDGFEIYWLPYQPNKTFHLQLGHDARYLFTPTMDGCSFAVGGQDPEGTPLVAHSNMQTDGQINQVAIDDQLRLLYQGQGTASVMKKQHYTGSKHYQVGVRARAVNHVRRE